MEKRKLDGGAESSPFDWRLGSARKKNQKKKIRQRRQKFDSPAPAPRTNKAVNGDGCGLKCG